jgi:putative transposase
MHGTIIGVSTRKIAFVPGEYYHVYNRGVDKRVIFNDRFDYERFMQLLYLCNSHRSLNIRDIQNSKNSFFTFNRDETLVSIGAYCLMPNHFHLLITPKNERDLSTFMNKVCTSYSMYFNGKQDRTGVLFQGKFKAEWADSDEYLKYLISYIHLNPVKLLQSDWKEKGIKNPTMAVEYLKSYTYSSFAEYEGRSRIEESILNREVFPNYFNVTADFQREILEWINYNPKA